MVGRVRRTRIVRGFLLPSLLTASWLVGVPMSAGAQPVAHVATELIGRRDGVSDRLLGWDLGSLRQALGSDGQTSTPSRGALTIGRFALPIGPSPNAGGTRWRDIRDGTVFAQGGTAKRTTGRGGFITRHPKLFGALVGAAVGGGAAYAKWGAEGTWVGFWGGAAAGAGIGALVSR
jgi:hypothetical protein